ncbi:MAG: hypothetical protein KIS61_09365 [Candidatus Eremiobacteraeota bacterium]|nr:hypothetical protein [Candidatus Eremiobacteraeota bacterium]
MTPSQVGHCAQVALYTKVHAVRLMEAGEDAADLASIFLDLFHATDFDRNSLATPQDAEDLLTLVASGYQAKWARKHSVGRVDPLLKFDPQPALLDLSKTVWLWRIVEHLRTGDREGAAGVAYRFIHLREQIRALTRPLKIYRRHGAELVQTLCQFVTDQAKQIERNQRHERPFIAPRRRTTRRPGFRGLGF